MTDQQKKQAEGHALIYSANNRHLSTRQHYFDGYCDGFQSGQATDKNGMAYETEDLDKYKRRLSRMWQSKVEAERERSAKLRDAVRGALGWFALWNDEEDQSKWPRYVRKCEEALAEYEASREESK